MCVSRLSRQHRLFILFWALARLLPAMVGSPKKPLGELANPVRKSMDNSSMGNTTKEKSLQSICCHTPKLQWILMVSDQVNPFIAEGSCILFCSSLYPAWTSSRLVSKSKTQSDRAYIINKLTGEELCWLPRISALEGQGKYPSTTSKDLLLAELPGCLSYQQHCAIETATFFINY